MTSMLIPGEWADAIDLIREDINRAYAIDLDREFLLGDGSPPRPVPPVSLANRIRWRRRVARSRLIQWHRRWLRRLWLDPRERLARRIAPWLMDDDEARERYY